MDSLSRDESEYCITRSLVRYTSSNDERQAEDYAASLNSSGQISDSTEIICYVLGTSVDANCKEMKTGNVTAIPRPYLTVIHQANARTFNLIKKIKEIKKISDEEISDKEITEVLSQKSIDDFD